MDKSSHECKMCHSTSGGRMVMVAVIITLTFLIGYGFGNVTGSIENQSREVCPIVKMNKQPKKSTKHIIPVKNTSKQATTTPKK